MMPYRQAMEKIIGAPALELLLASKVIQVIPLAFFRGLTLDKKVIIYDEAQNSTSTAMKSFLTRIGESSKMVIMGDTDQTDRKNGQNGLVDAIKKLNDLNEIGVCEFTHKDIVRHKLIGKILNKYEGN